MVDEMDHDGGQQRQGRQGKKGGNRKPMSQHVLLSKRLAFLLRHGAENARVKMYPGGWVLASDALEWRELKKLNATFEQVVQMTLDNDKKRYQIVPSKMILKNDEDVDMEAAEQPPVTVLAELDEEAPNDATKHLIRATQGHSLKTVKAEDLLTPIKPEDINPDKVPELVVHGTDEKTWVLIKKSGQLKPMTRQHVHFAVAPTGSNGQKVISGMRRDRAIHIWVNVKAGLADGVEWWLSANNVILSAGLDGGIPSKYWDRVEQRDQTGEIAVIWKSGDPLA